MSTPRAKQRESRFKAPLQSSRSYPSLLNLGSPIQSPTNKQPSPSAPLIGASKTAPLYTINEGLPPLSPKFLSNQSSNASKSRLSDLTRLANACFSTGQFDRAISLYTQALELNMGDACLWSNRGTAYVRLSLYQMGIRDYNQAIELLPSCGEFYYQRGVAYSSLKQYESAIQDYTSCITILPHHSNAYNNRGNAHRHLKNFTAADTDLKQACHLEPTSALYARNLQRVEQAIKQGSQSSGTQSPQLMFSTPVLGAMPPSPKLPVIQLNVDTTLTQSTQQIQSIYQSINHQFNNSTTSPLSPASPPVLSHLPAHFIQSLLQVAAAEQQQQSNKRKRSLDQSMCESAHDEALRDAICLYQLRSLSPSDSDYCSKKMRVTGLDAHSQHLLYDDDDESEDESSASEGSESPDSRHQLTV